MLITKSHSRYNRQKETSDGFSNPYSHTNFIDVFSPTPHPFFLYTTKLVKNPI